MKLPVGIRPTTDSARETIFNIIDNFISFENAVVTDLYAGTGAMGFEALSRGADKVVFIEKSRNAITVITEVAKKLQIDSEKYHIRQADVLSWLKSQKAIHDKPKYDLIFCDPPYDLNIANATLRGIAEADMANTGSIISIEHGAAESLILPEHFKLLKSKQFGETIVDLLKFIK